MYNNDLEYMSSRVVGTMMMGKDGLPYFVDTVSKKYCLVAPLNGGNLVERPPDFLVFEPPPLGYMSRDFGVHYWARVPYRRNYRQGIRPNNVRDLIGGVRANNPTNLDWYKCMLAIHPSVEDALDEAYNRKIPIPIDRNWAVKRQGNSKKFVMQYKWHKKVGIFDDKVGLVSFDKKFEYLQEEYMELNL